MQGRLSHDLPWLITEGNRILRADTSEPKLLRGINRSGLEHTEPTGAGFLAAAKFTAGEVREIAVNWNANALRIPFNQDWALRGRRGHSAEEYLTSLDQVISWAAELGAYTILDLQWLDADTIYGHTRARNRAKVPNRVAPTPNADSIVLWRTLAGRYRDEPAVIFDLFNEPHHPLEDDFLPIHLIAPDGSVIESESSFVGPDEWNPWAQRLVAEIRAVRPSGLILVAGVDWAFDLTRIRVDARGIVYSAHIYPHHRPDDWHRPLSRSCDVPVIVSEWGGTDKDLRFGDALSRRMRELGIGWTAWSWVDHPHLIVPPHTLHYSPTPFGALVRAELQRS
jgi:endoglucanase